MKFETIEEYLARGGKITELAPELHINNKPQIRAKSAKHSRSKIPQKLRLTKKDLPVKKSKAYYHYDAKLDKFVVKKRGRGKINRLFTGTKEECYNFIVDYNKKI